MASVTFPTGYGGSGETVSDDSDPNTGLANGGHRVRFVPALQGTVDMAAWTALKANEASISENNAKFSSNLAKSAQTVAEQSASAASASAQAAEDSAQKAAAFYSSVALALQETSSGQYFQVVEGGYIQLYRNDEGVAVPVVKIASHEEVAKLNSRPDPILASFLF